MKLQTQVEAWRSRLLDIGNRNPLVNTSFNPARGVLEIAYPAPEVIWDQLIASSQAGSHAMRFPWKRDLVPPPVEAEPDSIEEQSTDPVKSEVRDWNPPKSECTSSRRLQPEDLLTEVGDRALDRRLRTFEGYAELSISEQGVHCLFLAFGFLKWYESNDSTKELRSPLMLVPVSLSRDATDAPWELLEAEDDVIENLCLRQRLKQDFGLEIPALPELDELEAAGARAGYVDAVRAAIAKNVRWEVEERCCLGRFAFPKIAMWQDIGEHAASISSHALCQSIGGQAQDDFQSAFGDLQSLPEPTRLDDELAPGEIKAILDCDSSQLEAIIAARRGISFVLDGPPGTGKSQTIANIIADSLAEGKRVLFVSEKVSALEVVKQRLDDCGLGDFCLECHSSKANRKSVLEELKWCLEIPTEVYPDAAPKLNDLKRYRQSLNEYVRAIHKPQHPLGMSVYEFYGNIARLSRQGMLGKTRMHFAKPEAVKRDTLQNWVQLLELAKDVSRVIEQHDAHPWRGCKLTSKSLSLKDDIRNNLSVLATGAQSLAECLEPLVQDQLIPSGTTPVQVKPLFELLTRCLTVPPVPKAWFDSPREIANALLGGNHALRLIDEWTATLADYVDNVAAVFPDEIVSLSDLQQYAWTTRLLRPLGEDFNRDREELMRYVAVLRNLADDFSSLDVSIKRLVAELRLPVKANLPIGSVSKLVTAARMVSGNAPLMPGWFRPADSTSIVEASTTVLKDLDVVDELLEQVRGRISSEQLRQLAGDVADHASLGEAWRQCQPWLQTESCAELKTRASTVRRMIEQVTAIQGLGNALATCLQLDKSFQPTLRFLRTLTDTLVDRVPLAFHGAWADHSIRHRLQSDSEAVISDLKEAAEIRASLETRLSHRAFQPSARPLAKRGEGFASWWSRLVGGFGKYRLEVSDLYKAGVPETKSLLADLQMLRTFHKRLLEAEQLSHELGDVLIPGHAPEDPMSWSRLSEAVTSFDGLVQAMPELAARMGQQPVVVERERVELLRSRLADLLTGLTSDTSDALLEKVVTEDAALTDIIETLTGLADAISACSIAWQKASTHFDTPPGNFRELIEDIGTAKRYSAHLQVIESLYELHRDNLPLDAAPFNRDGWQKAIRGVDVVGRLTKIFGQSQTLATVLCSAGQINTAVLSRIGEETDRLFIDVERKWTEVEKFIELTKPSQPTMEARRRLLSDIHECALEAANEFELLANRLGMLVAIIRPGHRISRARLPEDAITVRQIREAQAQLDVCNATLASFNVPRASMLSDEELAKVEWVLQCPVDLLNEPLAMAIATEPGRREQVAGIAEQVRSSMEAISEPAKYFGRLFDPSQNVSTGFVPKSIPLAELPTFLRQLIESVDLVNEWIDFSRWRLEMEKSGLETVVKELLAGAYLPSEAKDAVCARFYQQLLDYYVANDPKLEGFDGSRHDQTREQFRQLDEWQVKAAATRVREYQLGREDRPRIGWLAPITSELGILKRETEKKRRHMPLRKLFNAVPNVLQRLKPCIMMSPLSVSTFLQSDALRFDVVIFDEASQVFPWDAIGAIYRGSQLIVAGDDKQLPPTSFFSRSEIEPDDEEDDIGDFESILTLCKSVNMPSKRLRWHYRSRREPLIAFSNRHFYDGDLVTFPSVRDAAQDAVRLEFIDDGRWIDRKNLPEAERVADLVIEHHRVRPDKSLGIIAFNATQQQAIEDAIYDRRRLSREIDALFDATSTEPMFVKNLENVQGDERDVILLSFAYGRNESGKFIKNFGPLSKPGGERRLNVAVTRAREEIVLVASVRAADMDLSGSTSAGAHLLKAYLEYAERGIDSLGRTITETAGSCESLFEEEVAASLIRSGLEPVPQVGCGGFRIDLALKHPDHPGLYCLGIECDGATYHSSRTARDRDRIRQSILEGLGWRIVRIWSTDWVRNPDAQLRRVLAAFESAVAETPDLSMQQATPLPELDSDDLQPTLVVQQESEARKYQKIEDVPDDAIAGASLTVLTRIGTVDWSDLFALMARELGFARTGKKIRERFEKVLHRQLKEATIHRVGDRISLNR